MCHIRGGVVYDDFEAHVCIILILGPFGSGFSAVELFKLGSDVVTFRAVIHLVPNTTKRSYPKRTSLES